MVRRPPGHRILDRPGSELQPGVSAPGRVGLQYRPTLPTSAPSLVSQQEMAAAFKEASADNILVVLINENGFNPGRLYGLLDPGRNGFRAETGDVAAIQ